MVHGRKEHLLQRSRSLRTQLCESCNQLSHSLHAWESGCRVLLRVRQHPEWLAAGATLLMLLRPERVSQWLRGALFGLRTSRQLLSLLAARP